VHAAEVNLMLVLFSDEACFITLNMCDLSK